MEIKTFGFACKIRNIAFYNSAIKYRSKIAIIKTITLTRKEFEMFKNDLYHPWSFLKDTCQELKEGIFTGVRITDGTTKIIVDTQGYDYARYVAIES
ncbi:MAG: hypothetical protein Q4P79_06995 [Fusobacterium sp.]|nr:hypothetical protein [Fusobacterium sp.]MDO5789196.1 hypothetical protein [Fusobacterium sp.]